MAGKTHIEWTEVTWNPVTGCNKVSAGCKYCYAERWAVMQQKRGIAQYRRGFELELAPNRLEEPFKWRSAKLVFVNSMSDLFHESIPTSYLKQVFDVMNQLPQHTFQVLTKRIERARLIADQLNWTKNIWLGVSVENNETRHRINILGQVQASVRFISFEPLLEGLHDLVLNNIHWVIVGGESGGKARTIEREWVKDIQQACVNQNVAFYFKQWGKRTFNPDQSDPTLDRNHSFHSRGGSLLDGQLCRQFPSKESLAYVARRD